MIKYRKTEYESVAEAKYPGGFRHRERAMVEIPRGPPGEEPFQVQTESRLRGE